MRGFAFTYARAHRATPHIVHTARVRSSVLDSVPSLDPCLGHSPLPHLISYLAIQPPLHSSLIPNAPNHHFTAQNTQPSPPPILQPPPLHYCTTTGIPITTISVFIPFSFHFLINPKLPKILILSPNFYHLKAQIHSGLCPFHSVLGLFHFCRGLG
jgi:hypothetical protein